MLLEDVFIIENLQVLNEGKGGPMRVRGVFQRADEENNNKRIYPKALLEREIQKLDEAMKGRRLMGELDHPSHDSVKLSNVSHLITKLEAKGNEIIGEAEILDTPMGKVAKALIEGGVQVGISSRGMGTLSEGQDGKRYVNEDFRLITWDLVADPSTRGAFPTLAESNNLNSMLVEEILNDVLPKVTQQKVFSTLLADRLDEKLRGKQHKLDKNKNGRLDSQDFKMLRGQRKDEALPAAIGAVAGGLARGAAVAGRAAAKGAATVGRAALKATKTGVKGATRAAGSMAREGVRSAGAAAGQTAANRVADRMERRTESTSFPRLSQIFEGKNKPTVSDSTLFARVGAVLFEGLPAASRKHEIGDDGKPTGTSYVPRGRTGTVISGYGKKGGRLLGKDGKPHAFAKKALKHHTQVDSTGKIPEPKK
jgi:hypothetical protein